MEINESNDDFHTLSASIKEELSKLPPLPTNPCIYRVPKQLRKVNEDAYTPIVVSIGPFHHKDERLLPMEVHKLHYLNSFLRASQDNSDLNTFLRIIKSSESEIRQSYSDPTIELPSDEFTRMVLIDSAFIIELFRQSFNTLLRSYKLCEPLLRPCKLDEITRDIKLVENQLPFFILQKLYWTAFKRDEKDLSSFTDIACVFLNINKSKIHIDGETGESTTCCHLLDLLRTHHQPSKQREQTPNRENERNNLICPTAISLYEAGINFQPDQGGNWFAIEFEKEKGILTIPTIEVDDHTEDEFRNLLAFEQCHYPDDPYIAEYHCFLDCLINTASDVELLVKKGVVRNFLGSDEEVSNLVNSLGNHVSTIVEGYSFVGIKEELNSYCKQPCNYYLAILKHKYFNHPWALISVVYAFILLVLTVVQVVTGILSAV